MKPTLAMDEKPAATIIQTPELPFERRQPSKGKWIQAGFSVVLALLAVILVIQVLSFRQLKDSSRSVAKKDLPPIVNTEVNYHIVEKDETVHERVTIDGREEDIITDKMRMIFDYQRGIVVTKLTDADVIKNDVCYVATFNNSINIDDVKEAFMNSNENEEAHLVDDDEKAYVSTGESVPRDLLSTRAQQMCVNSEILMVRQTDKKEMEENGKVKRACFWYYGPYCGWIRTSNEWRYGCATTLWYICQ